MRYRTPSSCETDEIFWCSTYQGLSGSFWCIRLYDRGIKSCQGSGGELLREEAIRRLLFVSCVASTAHLCTSMHMQEAEVTNAGLGSNLTLEGSVEADASIMLGNRTFAAVGAAPGLYTHSSLLLFPMEQDSYILDLAEVGTRLAMTQSQSTTSGLCTGLGSAIEAAAMLAGESRQPLALGRVRPM